MLYNNKRRLSTGLSKILIITLAFVLASLCLAGCNNTPDHAHDWDASTGKCKICDDECDHDYLNGVCRICGFVHVDHEYADNNTCHNRYCTVCNKEQLATTSHVLGENCVCTVCGDAVHNYVGGTCTACNAVAPFTVSGNYVTMGSYPQTKIKETKDEDKEKAGYTPTADDLLIQALNTASASTPWISYDYYKDGRKTDLVKYKDFTYNGEKYRAVTFTEVRSLYTQRFSSNVRKVVNGYYPNKVYWFKYAPIKWKIIEINGNKATVISDIVLDSQAYNNTRNNNYKNSSLREFLNDTFFNLAFSDVEKGVIVATEVSNDARSANSFDNAKLINNGKNRNTCSDTLDNVWVLSLEQATNPLFKLSRKITGSDYANVQGYNRSDCWLRTPGFAYTDYVLTSVFDVKTPDYGTYCFYTDRGVLPAMTITIK